MVTSEASDPSFLNQIKLAGAELTILPNFRHQPFAFIVQMRKTVLKNKPNILHSWMYFSNMASIVLFRRVRVVWSFHAECLSDKLIPRIVELLLIPASYIFPAAITFPSRVALKNYLKLGFCQSISSFIRNPIDSQNFYPDISAGKNFQKIHRYPNTLIVGCAARWHPQKGHIFLFDSLKKAIDLGADITLVCVGRYTSSQRIEVLTAIQSRELEGRIIFLGQQDDMRGFYNSLNLLVVPSHTEAFGNVIIEAYGCGVPVLSTNCGGPAEIIIDSEYLVPIGNVDYMAEKLLQLSTGKWRPQTDGLIEYAHNFSPSLVGKDYKDLYWRLA